jgi:hypothetical protein
MSEDLQYASSFKPKSITITGISGETKDITNLVQRVDYFESIDLPSVEMVMHVSDSGGNVIASLPIQGYEDVEVILEGQGGEEYTYKLKVFRVFDRFSGDRVSYYKLGLMSQEAILNETIRVPKTLSGKPDGIVRDLLQTNLKTKKQIKADATLFKVNFQPGKRTPFAIINGLKDKSVAQDAKNKVTEVTSTPSAESGGGVAPIDSGSYGSLGGSAGYLFYENYDGYNFRSIDALNSLDKNPPVKTFYQENEGLQNSSLDKIIDISFKQEINLLEKLRMGTYSSVIVFYNYSTGAYEEYAYSLKDSFKEMNHLGSQDGMLKGQAELANNPTRIMSALIDHETWFSEKEIASPEKKDGGSNAAEFPDWQKSYVTQSISRLNSLNNQEVKITIPIHPELKVGQTVEILIPNMIPTPERKTEEFDPEHSGVYLIAKLNHAYDIPNIKGNTHLTLIRDSYGRRDEESKAETA